MKNRSSVANLRYGSNAAPHFSLPQGAPSAVLGGLEPIMKSKGLKIGVLLVFVPALLLLGGCNSAHGDPREEAPPPVTVVADTDVSLFSVDHPEQFPLTAAVAYSAAPKLIVTGTVNPDISRNVPVISLATGGVV